MKKPQECIICGIIYINPHPWKNKTCSKGCAGKLASIRLYKNGKVLRKCVRCKKEFSFPKAWLKRSWNSGKYCSKDCRFKKGLISFDMRTKNKARHIVYKAVLSGKIKKLPCEVCGEFKSAAHHYLGYAEEHWFDIKWLCDKHHQIAHEVMRENNIHY